MLEATECAGDEERESEGNLCADGEEEDSGCDALPCAPGWDALVPGLCGGLGDDDAGLLLARSNEE